MYAHEPITACTGKAGHAWRIWWLGKDDSFFRIWPSIHTLFISIPSRLFEGRDIEQFKNILSSEHPLLPAKKFLFLGWFYTFFSSEDGQHFVLIFSPTKNDHKSNSSKLLECFFLVLLFSFQQKIAWNYNILITEGGAKSVTTKFFFLLQISKRKIPHEILIFEIKKIVKKSPIFYVVRLSSI